MFKLFSKYVSIGFLNTALHWLIFAAVYHFTDMQSISNVAGFSVAVTFSFFANARWTFNSAATANRYIAFASFMGLISWIVGKLADLSQLPPLFTLVAFSGINMVLGFVYSKFYVFRSKR